MFNKKGNLISLWTFNLSIFTKNFKNYIYIYNSVYFCIIRTPTTIKIENNFYLRILENDQLLKKINNFLKQFYLCEFSKIKFTGKGYKIKKNSKKSIILLFNRAHITLLWWNGFFLKKLRKYKLYLKYTNVNKKIVETVLNIRFVNIFTKKGLRQSRQILMRKKGKK